MKLPKLPRPSLPWVLLSVVAFGATGFGLVRLLTVEVDEWGILVDHNTRDVGFAIDGASLGKLFESFPLCGRLNSEQSKPILAGASDHLPREKCSWMNSRIPVLTFRSLLPLSLRIGVRFPKGIPTESWPAAIQSEGRLDWTIKLGRPLGDRNLNIPSVHLPLLDAENNLVISEKDTSAFLFYEGRLPRPEVIEARHFGKDSVWLINRSGAPLHDLCGTIRSGPLKRSNCRELVLPGDHMTLPGNGPAWEPRTLAIRAGLRETQARAFSHALNREITGQGIHPSLRWQHITPGLRWVARLDPTETDRLMPLEISWPLVRIRRSLFLTHHETLLDTNGCPENLGSLPTPASSSEHASTPQDSRFKPLIPRWRIDKLRGDRSPLKSPVHPADPDRTGTNARSPNEAQP